MANDARPSCHADAFDERQALRLGNDNFNNDCSAELRSLLMPFGVFLPRNSAAQIEAASRVVDLSQANTDERLRYLKEHGKPFTTLVYIPGHIMLYIGNAAINGRSVPMTYQNIWGLRPADSKAAALSAAQSFSASGYLPGGS